MSKAFRYNNRKQPMNDSGRFEFVLSHVLGKRLTYAELTGKVVRRMSNPDGLNVSSAGKKQSCGSQFDHDIKLESLLAS